MFFPGKPSHRNMLVGNALEHYDSALFALLSPYFATLFFPSHDPVMSLFLTYGIFLVGIVMKPFGSLFFGYIGDSWGRKEALFFSLFGMSCVTMLMGLLPTYALLGWAAPLLLCVGRAFQNFFSAGESVGGAIFVLENTDDEKQLRLSGWYGASSVAGVFLASCSVAILAHFNLVESHWRIAYLIGGVTGWFAYRVRRTLIDDSYTPPKGSHPSLKSCLTSIGRAPGVFLALVVAAGFFYACHVMAVILMNGFIPLISDLSKSTMIQLNTILLFLDMLLLPLIGNFAMGCDKNRLMLSATAGAVMMAVLAPLFLNAPSLTGVVVFRILLVVVSTSFAAPFHAWSQTLVSPVHRYTILSLSYAIGTQLLGGSTASLSLWLFKTTGIHSSVMWFWAFLALIASGAVVYAKRSNPVPHCSPGAAPGAAPLAEASDST